MDDTPLPRLPKLPFIIADVLLVLTAILIANQGDGPLSPLMFFWVIFCVALGAALACLPFYAEFKNHIRLAEYDKAQANQEIAERIELISSTMGEVAQNAILQAERTEQSNAAMEALFSRFDTGLQALNQQSDNKQLDSLKTDLREVSEALGKELKATQSASQSELRELLAELSVHIRDSLNKSAATSVTEIESDIAAELAQLGGRIDILVSSLGPQKGPAQGPVEIVDLSEDQTLKELIEEPETEADTIVTEAEAEPVEEAFVAIAEDSSSEEDALIEDDIEIVDDVDESSDIESTDEDEISFLSEEDEAELKASTESAQEEEDDDKATDSVEAQTEEVSESVAEDPEPDISIELESEATEPGPIEAQPNLLDDLPERSAKAKKAGRKETSIVANVLIGIGNKPYIRGEGPGLSMEEGIPMDFLEIGKWQWIAPETEAPIKVYIYKNDQTPAEGEAIEIEPGQKRTVSPRFL